MLPWSNINGQERRLDIHAVGERCRALHKLCSIASQQRKIMFYSISLYFYKERMHYNYDVASFMV